MPPNFEDLYVIKVKPGPGTDIHSFPGSFTKASVAAIRSMGRMGLSQMVLAAHYPTYSLREQQAIRPFPREVRLFVPSTVMNGRIDGFNGDPAQCEKMCNIWLPDLERQWKEMRRLSANRGGAGSLILLGLSSGGHLPICIENIKLAKEHFPDALKVGVFLLPTNEVSLFQNLADYTQFPDGIPIIILDNRVPSLVDRAFGYLISLFSLSTFTSSSQRTLREAFGQMFRRHKLFTLSIAHEEIPMIDVPWWRIGNRRGIPEGEWVPRVGKLICKVIEGKSKLLNWPDPPEMEPQFIAINAMGRSRDGETPPEFRDQFRDEAMHAAQLELEEKGLSFPAGASFVWSSVLDRMADNYNRLTAVRLMAVEDRSARDFVDDLLREDGAKRRQLMLKARSNGQEKMLSLPPASIIAKGEER